MKEAPIVVLDRGNADGTSQVDSFSRAYRQYATADRRLKAISAELKQTALDGNRFQKLLEDYGEAHAEAPVWREETTRATLRILALMSERDELTESMASASQLLTMFGLLSPERVA